MKCQVGGCENDSWSRGYCKKHHARLRRSGELKNLPKKSGGVCLAEGCDRIVDKYGGCGYCSKHYQRYKKHGDPHKADWKRLKGSNLEEKLKLNSIENENGCWIWQGSKSNHGYGSVSVSRGKTMLVHRLAFKLWCGELPDYLFVCHHCDEPLCVNPNHLFLGTNQDNIDDKIFKGRAYTGIHKGERNENSVLTEYKVKEIKKLLMKRSQSQSEIANEFGVSKQCITDIKLNRVWKHIPWPTKRKRKVKRRRRPC